MNEAEKEQALKLSALFKELAEKGTWFEVSDVVDVWHKGDMCPSLVSTLSGWRVADKPVEPKNIDLTKMVGSDVDMEFGKNTLVIGKLANMKECGDHVNYSMNHKQTRLYHQCRVRQDHIHYYNGVGNPLPDGLLVTLYFYNDSNSPPVTCKSQDIVWNKLYNVSGYEVIGTWPGYKYGWEK